MAENDPGRAKYEAAVALFEQGKIVASLDHLEEAFALAPEGSRLQADVLVQRAVVYCHYGDPVYGRQAVTDFMTHKDSYPDLDNHEARCHHVLGTFLIREKHFAEAATEFQLAATMYPDRQLRACAILDQANALAEMNDVATGEDLLERARGEVARLQATDVRLNLRVALWLMRAILAERRSDWTEVMVAAEEVLWILSCTKTTVADPMTRALLLQAHALEEQEQPSLAWEKYLAAFIQARKGFLHSYMRIAREGFDRLTATLKGGNNHA